MFTLASMNLNIIKHFQTWNMQQPLKKKNIYIRIHYILDLWSHLLENICPLRKQLTLKVINHKSTIVIFYETLTISYKSLLIIYFKVRNFKFCWSRGVGRNYFWNNDQSLLSMLQKNGISEMYFHRNFLFKQC